MIWAAAWARMDSTGDAPARGFDTPASTELNWTSVQVFIDHAVERRIGLEVYRREDGAVYTQTVPRGPSDRRELGEVVADALKAENGEIRRKREDAVVSRAVAASNVGFVDLLFG